MDDYGNHTGQRTLTDADIEALVRILEQRLEKKFYHDLGKGLWGMAWKGLMAVLLFVAAYGAGVIRWPGKS